MHRTLILLVLLALLAVVARSEATAQDSRRVFLPLVTGASAPDVVASYLGGVGADRVSGTDFDVEGRLLLAGRWSDGPIGGVPAALLPGGAGAVVRLTAGGDAVSSAARLGADVRDLDASPGGAVIACGEMGVVRLTVDLGAIVWSAAPGDVRRCAVGASGSVAALVGQTIYRYDADGQPAGSVAVAGTAVADVAIDEASGLVFATGYTQKDANLKVAFLRAYGPDGATRWTAYDHEATGILAANLGADSEGRRVTVGADSKLYLAGWTDGGNSIFSRNPRDLARALSRDELVKFDSYTDPFNISGAKSLAWYGRFEPATGALLQGQWLLTRLSDGKGNSISIQAIDAAADGTIAIAGDSAATIAGRATMHFAGVALGGYELGEAYLLVVSPDMRSRRLWTAFAAPGTTAGSSPATGVAIKGRLVAMSATLTPRSSAPPRGFVTTKGALQPANASPNAEEGYFTLIPVP